MLTPLPLHSPPPPLSLPETTSSQAATMLTTPASKQLALEPTPPTANANARCGSSPNLFIHCQRPSTCRWLPGSRGGERTAWFLPPAAVLHNAASQALIDGLLALAGPAHTPGIQLESSGSSQCVCWE